LYDSYVFVDLVLHKEVTDRIDDSVFQPLRYACDLELETALEKKLQTTYLEVFGIRWLFKHQASTLRPRRIAVAALLSVHNTVFFTSHVPFCIGDCCQQLYRSSGSRNRLEVKAKHCVSDEMIG
jgi:hypothetical protein